MVSFFVSVLFLTLVAFGCMCMGLALAGAAALGGSTPLSRPRAIFWGVGFFFVVTGGRAAFGLSTTPRVLLLLLVAFIVLLLGHYFYFAHRRDLHSPHPSL